MSKILSFGYVNEWEKNRDKFYEDNKHLMKESQKDGKPTSEYQSSMSKSSSKPGSRQRPSSMTKSEQ